jgi:hypothetical protein
MAVFVQFLKKTDNAELHEIIMSISPERVTWEDLETDSYWDAALQYRASHSASGNCGALDVWSKLVLPVGYPYT